MRPFYIFMGLALLVSTTSKAQEPEHNCSIQKTQDILTCALKNYPDVINTGLSVDRDAALINIAMQRPNPELESKWVTGGMETSLFHTLELGGKRTARIRQARAQVSLTQSKLLAAKEQVTLNTVLAFYRLRQIRAELNVLQEASSTFSRILSRFRSRPLLSPEQEVSLSLFHMAKDEAKLQQASLVAEETNLASYLTVATGLPYSQLKRWLPPPKAAWPKLNSSEEASWLNAEVKSAQAELDLAQTNIKLAKSKAWPDFKVGPTVEMENFTGNDQTSVGGSFSLPLPILSQNRGEIAYAKRDQLRANTNLEAVLRKNALERLKQVQRYQHALQGLRLVSSLGSLSAKHHEIEQFFEKGLVPSSLVTESHRQFFEIIQQRHEQELTALDALWRVYIIDGHIFLLEEHL